MSQAGNSKERSDGREVVVTPASARSGRQTVCLVKGRHRWEFSYRAGEEAGVLAAVSDLAGQEGVPFDWFDAALVGHQVARRLRAGLTRIDSGARTGGN